MGEKEGIKKVLQMSNVQASCSKVESLVYALHLSNGYNVHCAFGHCFKINQLIGC